MFIKCTLFSEIHIKNFSYFVLTYYQNAFKVSVMFQVHPTSYPAMQFRFLQDGYLPV